ncbi:RanBP1 domain protein [Talaromyces stipitatus ATCC 10500]|uniref:RanBP1 domain protein n=1 Tax=Talaromyces stipitatus (strain ATCC 10500 / CBS 375.48 / QM 6759 / NRRL 1006) TaxID=441959 RepID=B8MAG4_TALSN|nr:RanBP1 domain protein [Talaromyces stipitatus ATCC 10500]EED17388.1 RanBP1 domain protein [Talaromyces stipitatus ATCC 10500]
MSSTPNDTPQRATAAQLATRRIKELNKRRAKPATQTAPQTPFSFGDTGPSSSGASNGFSFGQSQSFPAPSASGAPQNGSQSVSFGAGSGSFNFGGFNSTPANNPFANLNGGNAQIQSQNQQSNIFGAKSSTQPAQPSGQGIFGQNLNSGFQSQPASTVPNPFAKPTPAPTSGPLFQSQPASTGPSLFGQTKPTSTDANLFGRAASPAPASTPTTATTAPSSLFGQNSTSAAPSSPLFQSKPVTNVGSTLFGQNPPPPTTGTTNLFGQSVGASSAGTTTTAAATNGPTSLFGKTPSASSGSSLFQPKPAISGTPNIFGQTPTIAAPGASLFGQSVGAKNDSTPRFTPSTPAKASGSLLGNAPSTGTFNFGQATATTQKPLFNLTTDSDDMSTSPDGKRKPSEQPSAAPSNIFGQKPAESSVPSASNVSRPTSSLFGTFTPSATANPPSPSISASSNIFGQQQSRSVSPAPNGVTTTASSVFAPTTTASTGPHPFSSLFAASSNKPATSPAPAPAPSASATTAPPTQSLFAGSSKSATTTAPSQSLSAGASQLAQKETMFASQLSPGKRMGAEIMDQGLSKKSAATPQVSAEESLEQDKRAQIRDLNRSFKELIPSYDPETQSLDSIILHYIRMRRVIGVPVGSLTNKPGKRKLDDAHGIESPVQRPTTKKSRGQEAEPVLPLFLQPSSSSGDKRKSTENLDDSVNSKRRAQPFVRPTTQAGADGKSETASIFASSFSAPKDATPASTASSSSNLFSFGALPAKETTRPASPQKEQPETAVKPAFEVPKFGNLAGQNFASQFGKGSFKASSADAPKVQLEVPKFGASGQSFMSQFSQKAKGDDTDEDSSDSEAEHVVEKKVEKPSSVQPQSNAFSGSVFDSKLGAPSVGIHNIFGHLNASTATSDVGESSDDDLTEELSKRAEKSKPDSEAEPKTTTSLFGRITRPDGTPVNLSSDEEKAETPKVNPLFGQTTPSTSLAAPNSTPLFSPASAAKASNIFGGSSIPSSTFNPFSSSLNPAAQLLAKEGTTTASVTSDSNAEDTDTETPKDAQLNLLTNAGEEDEDCIFEGRSRGSKYVDKSEGGKTEKSWEVQGVGPLRVLVNKETKRARLLLRADPSGKAVLNTAISRAIDYKFQPGGCSFLVPRRDGSGLDMWMLRFKKEITAEVENAVKTAKEGLPQ